MRSIIHFLNTGYSDCIILESNNHFAMIDAGEDSDFPPDKPHLNLKGYEKEVCEYLRKNCKNDHGAIVLDFVLGTHCHSDHIGGFDTVINMPEVIVKKAYLKPYHAENIFIYERLRWDNEEVYEQMKGALKSKNVETVESFDNVKTTLGDFNITFFNGTYKKPRLKFGENVNSVVTLIECYGKKALLMGDMNYKNGGEKEIAEKVGKTDLLKVGHHGYFGSTSFNLVKKTMPEYAVICNSQSRIYPDVKFKLNKISHSQIICTADVDGVDAVFDKSGVVIRKSIMK